MEVCCECCVLSGRGLWDGLITRPEESYRLWRVVVCDQETSNTRGLKPATGLWKYNHSWLWRQENKQTNSGSVHLMLSCLFVCQCYSKLPKNKLERAPSHAAAYFEFLSKTFETDKPYFLLSFLLYRIGLTVITVRTFFWKFVILWLQAIF
jgi:hypothetical protein